MKALLMLLLAGCGGADLCAYSDLKTSTCITVHLTGNLNPGEKDFDSVQVDVTYTVGSNEKSTRLFPMRLSDGGGATALPIALGVVYPDLAKPTGSSDRIAVLVTKNNRPVGYGFHRFILDSDSVKIGQHGQVGIELKPATASTNDCFDSLKESSERDVDCGGPSSDCPLCARGQKCFFPEDCASGACNTTSPEVCL